MEYQFGKIYKIICTVNSEFVYIGSTFQKLNLRWLNHKNKYKKYLQNGIRNMSTYKFYDKYGIQSFRIMLIKEYKVCRNSQRDNSHLRAYEQLWINKTKKTVNLKSAFNPLPKLDEKIRYKKYYENNKGKAKEYYQTNKEQINEKTKEYYHTNKEQISQKRKEHYQNNKEKITCECGINITRSNLSAHKKTKKHIKLMERYNKLKMLLLL